MPPPNNSFDHCLSLKRRNRSRMRDRVALLDRDGNIIVEPHYLADPNGVELLPHAVAGLRRLCEADFRVVLATNQSGIGHAISHGRPWMRLTRG